MNTSIVLTSNPGLKGPGKNTHKPRYRPIIMNAVSIMKKHHPHIALVGFMGAGKSSVGRLLSELTGFQFLDLDEVIVEECGKSIPEIFRDHGEGVFRAKERAALEHALNQESPTIIATGGGTFSEPGMHDMLLKGTRTVYLKTDIPSILSRVGAGSQKEQRPLLQGPAPEKAIEGLLTSRSASYEEAEWVVDTVSRSLDEVTDEILTTLALKPLGSSPSLKEDPSSMMNSFIPKLEGEPEAPGLHVHSRHGLYPVEFRYHAGPWIADAINRLTKTPRIAVITDSTVAGLHASALVEDLRARQNEVQLFPFEAGEDSKTLATASLLYDHLLEMGLTRDDTIVALGGGVVGDVTGFVASTFLRGIPYIQVPTTTLAAVDSSVGGKTAVNTPRGKNLVGTFHPPQGVFIAISHLATQTRRQHAAGLVEALKMAATLDAGLFHRIAQEAGELLDFNPEQLLSVLVRSIQLKASIVAQDEQEKGVRAVLNYGHTLGHAIEKGERYSLLHGEAVALGMVAEAEWAEQDTDDTGLSATLRDALEQLEVPVQWAHSTIDLESLDLDKKRLGTGGTVRVPIVPSLGRFEMKTVPISTLKEFVHRRTTS
jgi:3-dehydroquinate synthase